MNRWQIWRIVRPLLRAGAIIVRLTTGIRIGAIERQAEKMIDEQDPSKHARGDQKHTRTDHSRKK